MKAFMIPVVLREKQKCLTSKGSEKSGKSGTRTPTKVHTTMSIVHTPRTTTGQSAMSSA